MMTAAASAPREIGALRRAAMWLAHQQPIVLSVALVLGVAGALDQSRWLSITASVAMFVAAVTIGVGWFHRSRLCERCASRIPLDGRAAADQQDLWLRAHHWANAPVAVLAWVGLLGFSIVGPRWIAPVPILLLWIVTVLANLKHRPLARWCPKCEGWGEGGDDDEDLPVTPDPTTSSVPLSPITPWGR